MKEHLNIIDYLGYGDDSGKPMGHVLKVINEYSEMLDSNFNIIVIAPHNYSEYFPGEIITLKWYLQVNKKAKNKISIIRDMMKSISNICNAFVKGNRGMYWFININFDLYLTLFLTPKFILRDKKVYVTTFKQSYESNAKLIQKMKNYVLKNAQSKISCMIVSNVNIKTKCKNNIYIPDYYYDNDKYDKYKEQIKKDQIVCIGTMNSHKNLKEVIEAFRDKSIQVKIIGFFYDESYYEKLVAMNTGKNIIIENRYVDIQEYYTILGESKYVILPYDLKTYKERTSGILIEALFLDTIPIAPRELLDYNNVSGIAYDKLSELSEIDFDKFVSDGIIRNNEASRNTIYSYDKIKQLLVNEFKKSDS